MEEDGGKMEKEEDEGKKEEEEKGKDVRGGEDTERKGENKGFEYWYNNQK